MSVPVIDWLKMIVNRLNKYRVHIILCIIFFSFGIIVCQVNFDTWIPTNSSELAAWVQAVGATVGLGVAIWLSGAPYRQEKKNAVISARYFAKSLVEITTSFGIGIQDNKIATIALTNIALTEVLQAIRSVRPELLPAQAMNALSALRSIAAQLSVIAKLYENKPTAEANSDFLKFLKNVAGHIDGASRTLHLDMNGVRMEEYSGKDIADRVLKNAEETKKMVASSEKS